METCENPWLSIWTKPRKTISAIVANNANKGLWIFSAIYGFTALLNAFQSASLGDSLSVFSIILIALIFAPFWGWIVFSVWSRVVFWVGKLFKGGGSFVTIRAAFAWSCMPLILSIALWMVSLVFFGEAALQSSIEVNQVYAGKAVIFFLVLLGKIVGTIWSLVIYINTLAEVQKFSIVRSILTIVCSWVVIGVVLAIFWLCLGVFFHEPNYQTLIHKEMGNIP